KGSSGARVLRIGDRQLEVLRRHIRHEEAYRRTACRHRAEAPFIVIECQILARVTFEVDKREYRELRDAAFGHDRNFGDLWGAGRVKSDLRTADVCKEHVLRVLGPVTADHHTLAIDET